MFIDTTFGAFTLDIFCNTWYGNLVCIYYFLANCLLHSSGSEWNPFCLGKCERFEVKRGFVVVVFLMALVVFHQSFWPEEGKHFVKTVRDYQRKARSEKNNNMLFHFTIGKH